MTQTAWIAISLIAFGAIILGAMLWSHRAASLRPSQHFGLEDRVVARDDRGETSPVPVPSGSRMRGEARAAPEPVDN